MNLLNILMFLLFLTTGSCKKEELAYTQGDIRVSIETGKHWIHQYPLFLGLTKDNPPQFAIWLEDAQGHYLSTIFVTHKIATESWIANKGNRRKEALPHWCHQRGILAPDGLYLPTKDQPVVDGLTGATPKADKEIRISLNHPAFPLIIKAEFNHSLDFNANYPEDAKEGTSTYSGGKEGSGQPAVIYSGTLNSDSNSVDLQLIGHSSPDGSDGLIYEDLSSLTTAQTIVKSIHVQLVK